MKKFFFSISPGIKKKSPTLKMANQYGDILSLLATGSIAWGVYPKAPTALTDLLDPEQNSFALLLQWFMVFVLIWQGQGKRDVGKALLGTLVMFLFVQVGEYMTKRKTVKKVESIAEQLRQRYKR